MSPTDTKQLPWTPDDEFMSGWDDSYDVDANLGSPMSDEQNKKQSDLNSNDEDIVHHVDNIDTPTFNFNQTQPLKKSSSKENENDNVEDKITKMSIISSCTDVATSKENENDSVSKVAIPLVKLDDVEENFEEIMRKRNRNRKEREDHHIAHIKVQMNRLEYGLAAETKRRVDATTAIDELARTQVNDMEKRSREQLQQENDSLQIRLGALEDRVKTLELSWTKDANKQVESIQSKATDLGKSISQIREDQDMERKARLKREGVLLQQVEEHSKEFEDRWILERSERTRQLEQLENQMVRNEARLALEQKKYEERIETELLSLKEELAIEAVERQAQDEEIVAALNRYTQQLQHSLSILSSD